MQLELPDIKPDCKWFEWLFHDLMVIVFKSWLALCLRIAALFLNLLAMNKFS